ncbi:hypothetical protein SmJEL517_g02343 [Synchytrium microbalum]|uniref:ABC transporter domain-containing protein n=1 Tax=Synchytrium microbalum TaxID=1806994 RepID=A0A507CCE4_9FUNG|nr:uncharacterized protein SmJEL517_g02343 [Synchytrium microbalum]TPX35213.1 hypothetical protein SmJEL517_g02343 [Synchytrium microbalum]
MSANWTSPCFDSSAGTVIDTVSSCRDGFWCPNVTQGNLPVYCPPSEDCLFQRLNGVACQPQGRLEPTICPPGYYCPNSTTIFTCPAGSYCITGSTAPVRCDALASCPENSATQLVLMPIIACLLIDLAILTFLFHRPFGFLFLRHFRRILKKDISSADSPYGALLLEDMHSTPCQPDSQKIQMQLVNAFRRGLEGHKLSLRFDFKNVTLVRNGRPILTQVSGHIMPGKLTAILGPSGAGKTTFLNVLMGKIPKTSGELLINGSQAQIHQFSRLVGFVPQDDTMIPELTVRENILHSARIRLPRSWSSREVEEYVDLVIEILGLTQESNSVIGDVLNRGISGGQRKRVNIGMELAAVPTTLFLDEPTSGLDATTALTLMENLKFVSSRLGITVIAVIHQPRLEIFNTFDGLLLLAANGITSYSGPTSNVQSHFESLGYVFQQGSNPGDVTLDILNGKGQRRNEDVRNPAVEETPIPNSSGDLSTPDETIVDVSFMVFRPERTSSRPQNALSRSASRTMTQLKQLATGIEFDRSAGSWDSFAELATMLAKGRGASFHWQLYYCYNRAMLQQTRHYWALVLEIFVGAAAGLLMGIASPSGENYWVIWIAPYSILSPAYHDFPIVLNGLLYGLTCALAGSPPGVKVFGAERSVYWREASAGHSRIAYFMAKILSTILRLMLVSLHFASVLMIMCSPPVSLSSLFLIILANFWGVYGISHVVSFLLRPADAPLIGVIFSMGCAIFCGFGPTLISARSWHLGWLWDLSFNRWTAEALVSESATPYQNVYMLSATTNYYGYQFGRIGLDFAIAFCIGLGWRILSFALMVGLNRGKQR